MTTSCTEASSRLEQNQTVVEAVRVWAVGVADKPLIDRDGAVGVAVTDAESVGGIWTVGVTESACERLALAVRDPLVSDVVWVLLIVGVPVAWRERDRVGFILKLLLGDIVGSGVAVGSSSLDCVAFGDRDRLPWVSPSVIDTDLVKDSDFERRVGDTTRVRVNVCPDALGTQVLVGVATALWVVERKGEGLRVADKPLFVVVVVRVMSTELVGPDALTDDDASTEASTVADIVAE